MEFDLISYIKSQSQTDDSVILGIGDDAAVIQPPPDQQMVVSTDTLILGQHFDELTTAQQLGHKALAVSLSDLAAMAAKPRWVTLNLTVPELDWKWLKEFVSGFMELANLHQLNLVGGDITQGPCTISTTVFGHAQPSKTLHRSHAQRGDLIAVTGQLGSAACALHNRNKGLDKFLYEPHPQLAVAQQIKDFAHACIDISDGLLADLGHICQASGLGAKIALEHIPVNPVVKALSPQWSEYALSGGDDYHLCFTFSASDLEKLPPHCSVIGQMGCGQTVRVFKNNQEIIHKNKGFVHFESVNT